MKKWQCSKIIYLILLLGFFFCIIIFIDFQNIYIYKIFFLTIYIFNIFFNQNNLHFNPQVFFFTVFLFIGIQNLTKPILFYLCAEYFFVYGTVCLSFFSNIYINALNILNLSALCFLQATQKSATTNEIDWNELNGRIDTHYYKRI